MFFQQYEEGEALPSDQIGEKKETDSDDEEEYFDAIEALTDKIDSTELTDKNHIDNPTETLEIKDEEEEDEDEEQEDEEEDSDDGEGWITPANVMDVKRSMGVETSEPDSVSVGCLTTDFAMQNVLIQMGLNVLSIDGLLIKRAKSYVLRCFGCMRITKDASKQFCPHCGNKTLKRLSTTIEEDGSVRYWLAKNYTIRTRGTKYSLPRHQGGKHAMNPVLCEDQPKPDQRPPKKSLQKVDILSADIIADMSPFSVNDVTSRAAQLGIRSQQTLPQWSKRNPNENRKTSNKRKGK
uniref:Nin one binding (NOB1) Zn-ribbon-like domain-containing protein n=1 Tax=Arion vulgaris TaxID=1028688 RepID=A0A0B6ZEV6_9EUPU